jgi:release factor glutamine methyltransferase
MAERTLAALLAGARDRLAGTSESARLDSEVLLAAALGRPRSYLYTWPEHCPGEKTIRGFEALVEARVGGQPVAYLTGEKEFWSLTLKITPETLIPRPETELLVELALPRLPAHGGCTVLDLGTGSGAVALALARERPAARVVAVDNSGPALVVAGENATRHGLDNIRFVQGSWLMAVSTNVCAHAIVANPPYVASGDPHLGRGDPRFEPRSALVAGRDGLRHLEVIVAEAPGRLRPGGWLLLEHGYEQGGAVRGLMKDRRLTEIVTHEDLGGRERVTVGCWRG